MVNENLKQRIVGALVLVALAIIIIPLLFDFSDSREVDTHSKIPPRPEIQPVMVSEPVRPENIIPAKSDEEIFQFGVDATAGGSSIAEEAPVHAKAPPILAEESPALSSEGIPVAWVLQIGSFRDKDRAKILLNGLLGDGYKAFIREKKANSGSLSRVFVGPKVLKKKLVGEKATIDKKYGVDAMLVRFEP